MTQLTAHQMVAQFHDVYAHPRQDTPDMTAEKVSKETLQLRLDLIAEEFFELIDAVIGEKASSELAETYARTVAVTDSAQRDIVETADALADLEYVIHGFAHVAGIPLPDVVAEVHESNMSKLGADGRPIYLENGKVAKGPNYFQPDVVAVLETAGAKL